MIYKKVFVRQYTLEEKDINIIKGALEYCRHRMLKHNKCLHLTKERVEELISQFYE